MSWSIACARNSGSRADASPRRECLDCAGGLRASAPPCCSRLDGKVLRCRMGNLSAYRKRGATHSWTAKLPGWTRQSGRGLGEFRSNPCSARTPVFGRRLLADRGNAIAARSEFRSIDRRLSSRISREAWSAFPFSRSPDRSAHGSRWGGSLRATQALKTKLSSRPR